MSLTPKILKTYKAAIADKLFLQDIKDADNDRPSKCLVSDIEKIGFASFYYGWFVGKYGPSKWKETFH